VNQASFKSKSETFSTKKNDLRPMNTDWLAPFNDLESEIQLRHYYQKLSSHRGWSGILVVDDGKGKKSFRAGVKPAPTAAG
jgi:hypothetical protein